jgi:hypothetical protein
MLTILDHLGCVRTYILVMLAIPDHLVCVRTYIQVMLTILVRYGKHHLYISSDTVQVV